MDIEGWPLKFEDRFGPHIVKVAEVRSGEHTLFVYGDNDPEDDTYLIGMECCTHKQPDDEALRKADMLTLRCYLEERFRKMQEGASCSKLLSP